MLVRHAGRIGYGSIVIYGLYGLYTIPICWKQVLLLVEFLLSCGEVAMASAGLHQLPYASLFI
jgi:hypothetical protein